MPVDLISRVKHQLDLFYPPFLEKALELLARCRDRGSVYYVLGTGGYRTFAEQARLFFSGRTVKGPRLTNARPGQSLHNYGCAWDLALDVDAQTSGLQPSWNGSDFDVLREEGEVLGLQVGLVNAAGKRWDAGHVQLPISKLMDMPEVSAVALLKSLHDKEDLKGVWKYLDSLDF